MLPPSLVQAYRDTDYWCAGLDDCGPVSLRIDQPQPALSTVFALFRCECAAFITACNPLGQAISDAENKLRQQRLFDELKQKGYTGLRAEGRPLRPGWRPEASLLIPGMPLEEACETGNRYQQNAIVWIGSDLIARLHLLRE
jgi:hypothetical protein